MSREPRREEPLAALRALGRHVGTDRTSTVLAVAIGVMLVWLGATWSLSWLLVLGAAWFLLVDELWIAHRLGRMQADRIDGAAQRFVYSALVYALPTFVAWAAATGLGTSQSRLLSLIEIGFAAMALLLIAFDLVRLHLYGRPGGLAGRRRGGSLLHALA